jgi:hypothetical protein
MLTCVTFTLATALLCAATSFAAVPQAINYQAVLLDGNGVPETTQVQITFTLYDAPAARVALWAETLLVTPNADGQFSQILGQTNPLSSQVMTGQATWMGITVGGDAEMTPRTLMVSSPYSFMVETVNEAEAGVLKGGLTVQASAKSAAAASLTLVGTAGDSIVFNPAAGTVLHATNSTGQVAFSMAIISNEPFLIAKGPGRRSDRADVFGCERLQQ